MPSLRINIVCTLLCLIHTNFLLWRRLSWAWAFCAHCTFNWSGFSTRMRWRRIDCILALRAHRHVKTLSWLAILHFKYPPCPLILACLTLLSIWPWLTYELITPTVALLPCFAAPLFHPQLMLLLVLERSTSWLSLHAACSCRLYSPLHLHLPSLLYCVVRTAWFY